MRPSLALPNPTDEYLPYYIDLAWGSGPGSHHFPSGPLTPPRAQQWPTQTNRPLLPSWTTVCFQKWLLTWSTATNEYRQHQRVNQSGSNASSLRPPPPRFTRAKILLSIPDHLIITHVHMDFSLSRTFFPSFVHLAKLVHL